MTDKERIDLLEKQVLELSKKLKQKKIIKPWYELCEEINLDKRLLEAFGTNENNPRVAQTRSSICCIIGKAFCKSSVLNLDTKECDEAKEFINYVINFIKDTRNKYKVSDPVRGYERKFKYRGE
ncbi:hypothetical protein [Clostridium cochlearium]|uniref:hypothetical protein n=1 Tax=Clostridium cochlearium TaxID=1494 RepID=UPI000BBC4A15|nr:hypothetical protein [Clostridium cochlearium]